jgi:hypothetical protein
VLLFFLHGCGKKQPLQYDTIAQKKVPVLYQFEADVEGVECALCAQDAVDIFKSVDGVSAVDFLMTGTSYEQGYIYFCYDIRKNNLDLQKVDQAISTEGFLLHSLKGIFNIKVLQKEGRLFVAYNEELELPLLVSNIGDNSEKIIDLNTNETQFVQGKILRQSDNTLSFVPGSSVVKR